ncbi:triose-phosphate isomerase family protein [Microbacterium sp. NPDC028030]|uniref:triose-phosphate isomerase family protein n=1 Tax=Microbacterium sp. NPDC028030 TaxID=3155124 RepID=UPI003410C2F4
MADVHGGILLGIGLKAYLDVAESAAWASRLAAIVRDHPAVVDGDVRLFVLPALPALPGVRAALDGTRVGIGAQDLSPYSRGAYTGAITGSDLRDVGCEYVEVGHAERRRHFGEDDAMIARKTAVALSSGLTPVLCVGEPDESGANQAAAVCVARLATALSETGAPRDGQNVVVAYEPEWAIGRATAADPEHVLTVIAALRARLDELGWQDASVIYGGSAQLGTLARLGAGVDGLFLGRFAHDPDTVARIIEEAASVKPRRA